MVPVPIRVDGASVDLSQRIEKSTTVAASPALAAETVVCTITCAQDIAVVEGACLWAWVALTVGTDGTDVTVKIRRTGTSGTTLASTGILSAPAAAELVAFSLSTFDTGPTLPGQVYVVTVTVANASAASTVSGASLVALIV